MKTTNAFYKFAGPLLLMAVLSACNQNSGQSNISNCLADPICKSYMATQGNPMGTLTPMGTATVAAPTVLPSLATNSGATGTPATGVQAITTSGVTAKNLASGDNAFAKVAGASALIETQNQALANTVKANAQNDSPNNSARVTAASQLGADPSEGAQ